MTRRRMVLGLVLGGFLAVVTVGVVLAQGGQLGGKLLTGGDVTIPAGETVDHDIYAFAGSVVVNGTVNGDIVAAAGNVDLNGPVTGDVLAAGGRINVNGAVTGDVRAAGGQISIAGNVTEDVLAAGGQVTVSSSVGQDLIASGGQLTLSGAVAGSAVGSAGTYSKTGSVGGTDSITVTGDQAAAFQRAPSNPIVDAIRHFIIVLLVAFLALWLAPRFIRAAEAWVRERPLQSAGWGIGAFIGYFVVLIVLVIVMILLAILFGLLGFGTVVAIDVFGGLVVISGITLAFVVVAAFLADAIVGLALARLVVAWSGRAATPETAGTAGAAGADRWSELGWLALGVAIVVVLTSLPIIGGFIKLAVVVLALGALWLTWRQWRSGPAVTAATAPPPPVAPTAPSATAG
jgi:cytoskeletal protein CcmA (bactofilin family)